MNFFDSVNSFFNQLLYQPKNPLIFYSSAFLILFTFIYALQLLFHKWNEVRVGILLAFSLYFYYRIGNLFVLMVCGIALNDFITAHLIHRSEKEWKKRVLMLYSVLVNLSLLVYFRYTNFFAESIHSIFGGKGDFIPFNILVPVGISYYTFKSISYIIDVYREVIEEPETNFSHYLLYVSFFPNIITGPITRARELLPQFKQYFPITAAELGTALLLIITGYFKKAVIADYLGDNYVDRIFDNPALYSGFENVVAIFAYTVQLFFDFCGYTDMVVGLALLLGFRIMHNFNEPFKSASVTEFWRRWHITFSTFLNEYIYLPLSFYLRSWKMAGITFAIIVTFLISGIWHDAKWTFVIWGGMHGLALCYEAWTSKWRKKWSKTLNAHIYRYLSVTLTFIFLCISFAVARSGSMENLKLLYGRIVGHFSPEVIPGWFAHYGTLFMVFCLGLFLIYLPTSVKNYVFTAFQKSNLLYKIIFCFVMIVIIYQIRTSDAIPFIYLKYK